MWTRHVDIEPYIDRLNEFIFDGLDVQIIAPTHGLPILNPGDDADRNCWIALGEGARRTKFGEGNQS
jgi:hypothetical protein